MSGELIKRDDVLQLIRDAIDFARKDALNRREIIAVNVKSSYASLGSLFDHLTDIGNDYAIELQMTQLLRLVEHIPAQKMEEQN